MNIGNIIKSFLLSVIALIAPYLMKAFMGVAIPLIVKSIDAVSSGNDAQIAQAKEQIKGNWGQFVNDSRASALGTPSPVDDWLFNVLSTITLDDEFVAKLFDQAVKLEKQFFRPAQS